MVICIYMDNGHLSGGLRNEASLMNHGSVTTFFINNGHLPGEVTLMNNRSVAKVAEYDVSAFAALISSMQRQL